MSTVIFIGGTSHSGSTILDLLLSNHTDAMSLGEIHALMRPFRSHHFQKRQELISKDRTWKIIIENGEKRLYENLKKYYPTIKYFIDSSKDPDWITLQRNIIKSNGSIEYKNILIFKTPFEFAYSLKKRGLDYWKRSWKHYYRYYLSFIERYYIVSYKDICTDEKCREKLRKFTGINFSDKEIINRQNNFFGSTNQHEIGTKKHFLRYNVLEDKSLIEKINKIMLNDSLLYNTFQFLDNNKNTYLNNDTGINDLKYTKLKANIIFQKRLVFKKFKQLFPDHSWS